MKCIRCGEEVRVYRVYSEPAGTGMEPMKWSQCESDLCGMEWSVDGPAMWWGRRWEKDVHRAPWGCLLVLVSDEVV